MINKEYCPDCKEKLINNSNDHWMYLTCPNNHYSYSKSRAKNSKEVEDGRVFEDDMRVCINTDNVWIYYSPYYKKAKVLSKLEDKRHEEIFRLDVYEFNYQDIVAKVKKIINFQ